MPFSNAEVDVPGGYKHRISYHEILKSTEEFSDRHLIGSGRFGRVYKVLLREADKSFAIAAKVLKLQEEGKSSLIREMEALKFVRHRNIVRFLGFVFGGRMKEDILFFEYMAKGSLGEALKSHNLGWKIRLNIALGVAQALKYLHHDCSPPIVHRDIKSANILLDDECVAHVADFGLAKLMFSEAQSSSVYVGTHGYMAPGTHFSIPIYLYGLICFFVTSIHILITGHFVLQNAGMDLGLPQIKMCSALELCCWNCSLGQIVEYPQQASQDIEVKTIGSIEIETKKESFHKEKELQRGVIRERRSLRTLLHPREAGLQLNEFQGG